MYKQFRDKGLSKALRKRSANHSSFTLSFIVFISLSSTSMAETPTEEEIRDAVVEQMTYMQNKRRATREEIAELVAEAQRTAEMGEQKETDKPNVVDTLEKRLKQQAKVADVSQKVIPIVKEDNDSNMTPLIVSDKQEEENKKLEEKTSAKLAENKEPSKESPKPVVRTASKPAEKPVVEAKIDSLATQIAAANKALSNKAVDSKAVESKPIDSKLVVQKIAPAPVPAKEKKVAVSKTEPKEIFPVGRNEPITGWVYLGKFDLDRWENGTLEVNQELPKVGSQYFVKASTLNLRSSMPKKGKLGKVLHAFQQREQVKILQLRGSGRNHHYWAEVIQ